MVDFVRPPKFYNLPHTFCSYTTASYIFCFFSREGFKVFIGADFVDPSHCYCPTEEISLSNLALFPPFLRFDNVVLPFYRFGASKSITEKCQLFDACLSSIKEALIDSNKIFVYSHINQESAHHFSDHQTLLDYLSKRLLPICASSRSYNFWLWFHSDENSMGNVIDSILRMPQVGSSSNVAIDLYTSRFPASIALPVETISTWLNRNADAMKSYQKGVFLRIFSHRPHQNFTEMFALLKMVNSFNSFQNKYFLVVCSLFVLKSAFTCFYVRNLEV